MKKPQRIPYRSKKTGETKVYEYKQRDYRIDAVERCRRTLQRYPLKLIRNKSGGARWASGPRGHVFNDATVQALIRTGVAVCLGEFIELKGKVR
jgi:hypothetical protein